MIAFLNNQFLPAEEVRLPLNDLGLLRGYGVFDFFRTVRGIPLFGNEYVDRFYRSAAAMRLWVPVEPSALMDIVHLLIARNNITDTAGIRLLLTGGNAPDGYTPGTPTLLITTQTVTTPDQALFERGWSLITWPYQRDMPEIKTTDYKKGIWLQTLAREKGADEVLYYQEQEVLELPRCNVFAVTTDNQLITPGKNVLRGITRSKVLELAQKSMAVSESSLNLEQLAQAAELFVTATTKRILPVTSINGQKIGDGHPGPVTRMLYREFLALESAYTDKQAPATA